MKSRSAILLILLCLCCCMFWLSLHFFSSGSNNYKSDYASPSQSNTTINTSTLTPVQEIPIPARNPDEIQSLKDRSNKQYQESLLALMTPIEFYGMVLDLEGLPISGAKVTIGINSKVWESDHVEKLSDPNGFFELTDKKGLGITVSVSKEGYDLTEKSSKAFHYSSHLRGDADLPSKENPTLFTLRKRGISEPLIYINKSIKLNQNKQPVKLAFDQDETVIKELGDLQLTCYVEKPINSKNRQYSWYLVIKIIDGGLIKTKNRYERVAPTDGYLSSLTIEMPSSLPKTIWSAVNEVEFFAKTRSGKYALVKIKTNTAREPFALVTLLLNPSGSRNLEFDPSKKVELK
jgi:hypothetical protein